MITTKGQLYQWDTGRLIEVYPVDNYKVDEIHVFNGTTKFALVLKTWVDEKNGRTYAKIPDVLLQSDNNMDIYAVMSNDLGEHTQKHINVTVLRRAKPEDYVYTETEILRYAELEKRIEELEKNGTGNSGGSADAVISLIKPLSSVLQRDENGELVIDEKGFYTFNASDTSLDLTTLFYYDFSLIAINVHLRFGTNYHLWTIHAEDGIIKISRHGIQLTIRTLRQIVTGFSIAQMFDHDTVVHQHQTLLLGRTEEYIPTTNYSPAPKKYVDDAIAKLGENNISDLIETDMLPAVHDADGSILAIGEDIILW